MTKTKSRTKRRNGNPAVYRKLSGMGLHCCEVCGWTPPPGLEQVTARNIKVRILEVHHVRPYSRGGSDSPENLLLLCPNHHRVADVLCAIWWSVDVKQEYTREALLKELKLIERDPAAWVAYKKEMEATTQAELTGLLSDILHAE